MAMRQYIGARYVPKYSDINDGVWDNTYSYEALIIVRYGNDYYTSKQPVPVGIPITNTEYWIKTGNYNGAISAMDTRLTAAEGDITDLYNINKKSYTLTNRKFIFISDSYGAMTDLFTYLVSYMALASGQYSINVESGDSFIGSAVTGKFIDRLVNGIAAFTNADEITDIVILGGLNDSTDAYTNETALDTAISDFCSYAKINAPNAQIHLGYVGYVDISSASAAERTWYKQYLTCNRYIAGAGKYGMHYMSNIEYALRGIPGMLMDDGVHPSASGAQRLAEMAAECILTGSCDCKYTPSSLTYNFNETLPAHVSAADLGMSCYTINNGLTGFTFNPVSLTFDYDSTVYLGNLSWDIEITNYPFVGLLNETPIGISVEGQFIYEDSGVTKYMICPATVYLMKKKIRIILKPFINGSNNWLTVIPKSFESFTAVRVSVDTMTI